MVSFDKGNARTMFHAIKKNKVKLKLCIFPEQYYIKIVLIMILLSRFIIISAKCSISLRRSLALRPKCLIEKSTRKSLVYYGRANHFQAYEPKYRTKTAENCRLHIILNLDLYAHYFCHRTHAWRCGVCHLRAHIHTPSQTVPSHFVWPRETTRTRRPANVVVGVRRTEMDFYELNAPNQTQSQTHAAHHAKAKGAWPQSYGRVVDCKFVLRAFLVNYTI